jgi:hypothetical protein
MHKIVFIMVIQGVLQSIDVCGTCPLLAVGLLELSGAVPDVVVVLAAEHVAVAERVRPVALLDAALPVTDVPNVSF